MARTKKASQELARIPEVTRTKNPFAFPLKPDTPLGNAMLIAEFADGTHQPVDVISNIAEACESRNRTEERCLPDGLLGGQVKFRLASSEVGRYRQVIMNIKPFSIDLAEAGRDAHP